jgi:hypothetical protein
MLKFSRMTKVPLSEDTYELVLRLGQRFGLTPAGVIELLVRDRSWREGFIPTPNGSRTQKDA